MIRLCRCLIAALSLSSLAVHAGEPADKAQATLISLERQTTGTYYIDGVLSGYGPVEFLVDTGSSFLVINEDILNRLKSKGKARFDRELEGVMANGARMSIPLYRLSGIRLGDGCWIHDVDAAVFPNATRAILGMNVLTRLAPFTFMADPPALALNQCGQKTEAAVASGGEVMAVQAAPKPRATAAAAR